MNEQEIRGRVWKIILRYARPHPFRPKTPLRCTPSRYERECGRPVLSVDKIIYDSLDSAKRAAQEMFQVTGLRTEVYTCHRSTRKHHKHLTTDDDWMRKHKPGESPARDKRSRPS